MGRSWRVPLLLLPLVALALPVPARAAAEPAAVCAGMQVVYRIHSLAPIPFPGGEAHSFNASITLSNTGKRTLRGPWSLSVNFTNQEVLTAIRGAELPAGATLPVAGTGTLLSSPTRFKYLQTALQAAGQTSGYEYNISLAGTELGAGTIARALPAGVDLLASGFSCGTAHIATPQGTRHSRAVPELHVCCAASPSVAETSAVQPPPPPDLQAAPAKAGPIAVEMEWDVLSVSDRVYQVFVRVSNTQRFINISSNPGWALSWTWQMGEVILSCQGCQSMLAQDCEDKCDACAANPSLAKKYPPPYSCDARPIITDGSPLKGALLGAAYGPGVSSTNFTLVLAKASAYWKQGMPPATKAAAPAPAPAETSAIAASSKAESSAAPTLTVPAAFTFTAGSPFAELNTFSNESSSSVGSKKAAQASGLSNLPLAGAAGGPSTVQYPCAATQPVQPPAILQLPAGNVRSRGSYVMTCSTPQPQHPLCAVSASAFFNKTLAPGLSCACQCPSPLAPLLLPESQGGNCSISSAASSDPAAALLLGKNLAGLTPPDTLAVDSSKVQSCGTGCPLLVHLTVAESDAKGWVLKGAVLNEGKRALKNWTMLLTLPPGLSSSLIDAAGASFTVDAPPFDDQVLLRGIAEVDDWILPRGGNVIWALRFNQSSASSFILEGTSPAPAPTSDWEDSKLESLSNEALASPSAIFPTEVAVQGVPCTMPPFLPLTHVEAGGARSLLGQGIWSSLTWTSITIIVTMALCGADFSYV